MTKLSLDDTALDITADGRAFAVTWDGQAHRVEILDSMQGRMELLIDGRRVAAYVSSEGQACWVTIDGRTARLTKASTSRRASARHDASSELAAPMPGQVRAVNVTAGDTVVKGQVLVVLEAMKMEIRLQAPFDGRVSSVAAAVGETVEREQVLVKLEHVQTSQS